MINMIYFSKQFNRRRFEKPYESKPIGSALKMKRKELKMTLEESSEGICSISYLSKLENNLIEPNDVFVSLLMKRLNISEEKEIEVGAYKNDLNVLLECMLSNQVPDLEMMDKYRHHQDQQSLLIMMCYNSILSYKDEVLKSYDRIKVFIPNLNDFEAAMLATSLSITLYHLEHYQTAYNVLKVGARNKKISESLKLLIMKWTLLSAFKMRKINDMTNLYDKFLKVTTDMQYFKLLKDVNLEYYKLYSVYEEPEKTRMMMHEIRDFSKAEKDLIYAKSLYAKKQYDKLYQISKDYQDQDSEWFMIHAICLDSLKKENELMKHLEKSKNVECLSETCILLMKHIKIKYSKDKNELLRYLRNDLLSHRLTTDNYDTIEYLMTDASQLFSYYQFYKESSHVAHEMAVILKSMKMSMQNYDEE